MKRQLVLVLVFIHVLFQACKKEALTTLSDTSWRLVQFADAIESEVHNYPKDLADYILFFDSEATFSFPNGCNYRQGAYNLNGADTVVTSSLGPGTDLGCGELNRWESRVVRVMQKPFRYNAKVGTLTMTNQQGELRFKRIR